MQYWKKVLIWAEVAAMLAAFGLVVTPVARATWTVDLADLTTDATTIGLAVLAVGAVILGFRIVRGMIHR